MSLPLAPSTKTQPRRRRYVKRNRTEVAKGGSDSLIHHFYHGNHASVEDYRNASKLTAFCMVMLYRFSLVAIIFLTQDRQNHIECARSHVQALDLFRRTLSGAVCTMLALGHSTLGEGVQSDGGSVRALLCA
eukprot:1639711-Pleurochrysis_carterae.AAC.1